jgi:predicted PurR-regulated permease PerM
MDKKTTIIFIIISYILFPLIFLLYLRAGIGIDLKLISSFSLGTFMFLLLYSFYNFIQSLKQKDSVRSIVSLFAILLLIAMVTVGILALTSTTSMTI